MLKFWGKLRASVIVALVAIAVQAVSAVDVKVDFEKTFDFTAVKTWSWNPMGPGEIRMVRSASDDPDAMRVRAEPVIMSTVLDEMTRRGFKLTTGNPDVTVTYFLLLSTNVTTQQVGQFLPANAMWGVPPFAPSTQSMEIMNQGSLVLDLNASGKIVWRGVAQAKIQPDAKPKKRDDLLREAVRDLLKRVPKK